MDQTGCHQKEGGGQLHIENRIAPDHLQILVGDSSDRQPVDRHPVALNQLIKQV